MKHQRAAHRLEALCSGVAVLLVLGFWSFAGYSYVIGTSKASVFTGPVGLWLAVYFLCAAVATVGTVVIVAVFALRGQRWRRSAVWLLSSWVVVVLSYVAWHFHAKTQYERPPSASTDTVASAAARMHQTGACVASLTLWQAVEALASGMPLSVKRIEAVLHNRFVENAPRSNEASRLYASDPVSMDDGVLVRDLDLRVRRSPPHPAFLLLGLAGRCVTLGEVREHYADLRSTGVPRGHSPDEATTYSSSASWGRLSFGFQVSNPTCVAFVAFDPAELQ